MEIEMEKWDAEGDGMGFCCYSPNICSGRWHTSSPSRQVANLWLALLEWARNAVVFGVDGFLLKRGLCK